MNGVHFFEAHHLCCKLYFINLILFRLTVFVFYGDRSPFAGIFWMLYAIAVIITRRQLYYVGDSI